MGSASFMRLILGSPFAIPYQRWQLDPDGQPKTKIIGSLRYADLIALASKPKKRRLALPGIRTLPERMIDVQLEALQRGFSVTERFEDIRKDYPAARQS